MKKKRTTPPRGRYPLVAFILEVLIYFLKNDVKSVTWVNGLSMTENGIQKEVSGLNIIKPGSGSYIYLDAEMQSQPLHAARILLHELLHLLLAIGNDEKEEYVVRRFERLLWERMTDRQKQRLANKLPKKTAFSNNPD